MVYSICDYFYLSKKYVIKKWKVISNHNVKFDATKFVKAN